MTTQGVRSVMGFLCSSRFGWGMWMACSKIWSVSLMEYPCSWKNLSSSYILRFYQAVSKMFRPFEKLT